MCRVALTIVVSFLLTSCAIGASDASLDILKDDFKPESKTLLLMNKNSYEADMRVALATKGFKVLKKPTRKKIVEKTSRARTEIYDDDTARYGIDIKTRRSKNYCFGVTDYLGITAEIVDIITNEVVAVIWAGGGVASNCGLDKKSAFQKFAEQMELLWNENADQDIIPTSP